MVQPQSSKLILFLIMGLGLVLGYLYSSSSDPAEAVPPLELNFQLTSLQPLKSARIDSSILSDTDFTSLRIFGSLPVQAGAGGKSNPFE